MVGVKFPVLYVWPATDIKGLIFSVVRMHFALASNRTQTHLIDFRNSMTGIRKISLTPSITSIFFIHCEYPHRRSG